MTTFSLKIIAVISMLIDHLGYVFFPQTQWLRFVGRLAFPIYAFLLVQGYLHTRNTPRLKKYIIRMLIFCFVSEISFDLCFYKVPFYWDYQNVYFTLFLGLLALYLYEWIKSKNHDGFYVILVFSIIAYFIKSDYSFIGIIAIFTFYFAETWKANGKSKNVITIYLVCMFVVIVCLENLTNAYDLTWFAIIDSFKRYGWVYIGTFFSLIPISLYSGKLGYKTKASQIMFYIFYPLHLTIIYLVFYMMYIH